MENLDLDLLDLSDLPYLLDLLDSSGSKWDFEIRLFRRPGR